MFSEDNPLEIAENAIPTKSAVRRSGRQPRADAIYTHRRKPDRKPKGLTNPPVEIKKRFRTRTRLVTRCVAAFLLGISISELNRRENDGVFYGGVIDSRGRAWYDEENIERIAGIVQEARERRALGDPPLLPVKDDGRTKKKEAHALKKKDKAPPGPVTKRGYDAELAAKVFVELQKGTALPTIIIDQKVHPEDAIAIQDAYARVIGGFVFTPSHMKELAHLPFRTGWPPRNAGELIMSIRAVMESELQRCVKCQRGYARLCATCAPKPIATSGAAVDRDMNKTSEAQAPDASSPAESLPRAARDETDQTERASSSDAV